MAHHCGHLLSITLNSPCEHENQTQESLAGFLQGIEPSSIFPAGCQRAAVLNEENRAFSHAFENIEPQNTKKFCRCQRRKRMLHNYQVKMSKEILPHLF